MTRRQEVYGEGMQTYIFTLQLEDGLVQKCGEAERDMEGRYGMLAFLGLWGSMLATPDLSS